MGLFGPTFEGGVNPLKERGVPGGNIGAVALAGNEISSLGRLDGSGGPVADCVHASLGLLQVPQAACYKRDFPTGDIKACLAAHSATSPHLKTCLPDEVLAAAAAAAEGAGIGAADGSDGDFEFFFVVSDVSRPAGTEEPASHEYRAPKPESASRVAHPSSSTLLGTTTVICVPVSSCAAAASSSGNNRARLSGEQCTKVFCPTKESAPTSEAAAGGWRCIAPSHQGAPGSRTEREWFPAYE